MRRPVVRKVSGQWVARHPGYGFGRPFETAHASWTAALESTEQRLGGSSCQVERSEQFDYDRAKAAH